MDHVILTSQPLNLSEISDLVFSDSCGAVSFFVGTTRDNFENKKVLSLEYEAYEPMALKQMKKICQILRSRWTDIVNIAIFHRLGQIKVREASVVIAISSPHRQTALDAISLSIEELKRRVPIWKKEKYDDNEESWKENAECSWLSKKSKNVEGADILCQSVHDMPENLVQIAATEAEIDRRIHSFIHKKRAQIDLNNALDFIGADLDQSKVTCARTDSVMFRQEDCNGHLKVRRARNAFGPQTRPNYLRALDMHMSKKNTVNTYRNFICLSTPKNKMTPCVIERLSNMEEYLRIKSASKTIHQRLKEVEDRILSLEAMSPEYKHFLDGPISSSYGRKTSDFVKKSFESLDIIPTKRKTYTIKQLDDIIKKYETETQD